MYFNPQERLNRAIDAEDKIRLQKELAIAKRQGKIDKSRSTEEKNDDNIVENKIGCYFYKLKVKYLNDILYSMD